MEKPTTTPQGDGPNVAAAATEGDLPTGNAAAPDTPPEDNNRNRTNDIITWVIVGALFVAVAIRWPSLAYSIAAFIVTLSALVFVHEWGHYQFARWAGMKVNRFAIGFPPWIYTRRHKEIDYSIGALPIGGMVDIAGLGSEEEMVATASGSGATTRAERPDMPHGEKHFQDASLGWRFMTLFAGPLMNFLFSVVVFILAFSLVGQPIEKATQKVDEALPNLPAAKAGILKDDVILSVDGKRASSSQELMKLIRYGKGEVINVGLERAGRTLQVPIQTIQGEVDKLDGSGKETARKVGIQFATKVVSVKRMSLQAAVVAGAGMSADISLSILKLLRRLFMGQLSKEEAGSIQGPVGIAKMAGEQAQRGWFSAVVFAAGLSVNLGLLNLLPFPALDGGRILFLGYELIARRPMDPRKENLVHMVGMVMLLALIVAITAKDVWPFIHKGWQKIF